MNYIAVVQAKYESEVYPGKCLAELHGISVGQFLLRRLKECGIFSHIIVATTTDSQDDVFAVLANAEGVELFRGSNQDVLGRIHNACAGYAPQGVVKLMGNAPLVDVSALRELVREHYERKYDYAFNEHVDGVIYGMGCSVFSFDVIKQLVADKNLTADQREIGSLFIRQHPERFRILKQIAPEKYPNYRVQIDEPKDIDFIRSIIQLVPEINNFSVGRFIEANPLLAEYQKGSNASETGLEKLFLFPVKIGKYTSLVFDETYPVSVELSLTNRCNFDCIWCSDSDLRDRLGGEFTSDELKVVFKDLAEGGTKGVVIEGGGEPMIHPQFVEIVRAAKNAGLSVGLISNGSVPMPVDLVDYFEWIRISLDAATPQQHAAAKKVEVFERVMKNIRTIGTCKTTTTLGVGYVVTNDNTDNLESLLLRLRGYNVDYIQFRPVIDNPDLWPTIDLTYLKKFEKGNFRVDINAMFANHVRGNGGKPCVAHSISTVVTADGGVYLCGRLNIYDWVKPIGNLHRNSFREIWLGEERRRQAVDVGNAEFCRVHCPECRMTKYNLLMDRVRNFKTKNFI